MLRATGHTLKVSSCASVDGRGELRRAAEPTPNGADSLSSPKSKAHGRINALCNTITGMGFMAIVVCL